jgi:ribonuclease P/MRP protein subunit POP1
LEHLQKLTSKECGLTFGAKAFLDGTREGSVMLFHQNTFPYGAIGRVSFLWRPAEKHKSDDDTQMSETRTLWIWVHPAMYQELLDELILLFHFILINNAEDTELNKLSYSSETFAENSSTSDTRTTEETIPSPAKKKRKLNEMKEKKNVEETKLATRNVPFIRTPKYQSTNGSIEMVLLKDTLNRFRLTGPLSQAVLLESLHVANILDIVSRKNKTDFKEREKSLDISAVYLKSHNISADDFMVGERESEDWRMVFYGESHHKESWHYQQMLWQMLKGAVSPAQLPPHFVLALTIQDPRLQLPSKRTKAVPDKKGEVYCLEIMN